MSGSAGVQTLTKYWNVSSLHCCPHFQSPFLGTSKTPGVWLAGPKPRDPSCPILISTAAQLFQKFTWASASSMNYWEADIDIWAVFSWENTRKCCYDLGNPSDFTEHTWTLLISQSFPVSQTSAPKIGKHKRAAFLPSHLFSWTEYDVWQSRGSIHP